MTVTVKDFYLDIQAGVGNNRIDCVHNATDVIMVGKVCIWVMRWLLVFIWVLHSGSAYAFT